MINHLTNSNFTESTKNKTVLIDFYAEWCGPCRMLGPIIEQVSESNPDISFYKVNVDEESELAHKFRVSSIPTVVIFKDEKIVDKFVGYLPVEQIQSFINKNK